MSRQPAVAHRTNMYSAKNPIRTLDVVVHKTMNSKAEIRVPLTVTCIQGDMQFTGICNLFDIRIKIEKCKKQNLTRRVRFLNLQELFKLITYLKSYIMIKISQRLHFPVDCISP